MQQLISFITQSPHKEILIGDYLAYMAAGYYPREKVEKILPLGMSIPSAEIMARKFPTVKKIAGMHPFMLQIATGNNVRMMFNNQETQSFPTYQEVMFYIPVIYSYRNEQQLCSYVPVLYLDFLFGVIIGNLYYGFRKEYHPEMNIEETDRSKKCTVKDIINMSFKQRTTNRRQELDPFFVQIFENPTLTVSYLKQHYFYTTKVYKPTKVIDASPLYEWHYKGSVIRNNTHTFANYSEFTFTLSKSMRYNAYFHP